MKTINITKKTSISFGAWDGVCNKSKTQENNALYTEVWIGKVEYKYPENLICTMYIFCFFRILKFKTKI